MVKRISLLAVSAAVIVISLSVIGCQTIISTGREALPPKIEGAEFVGMETCAMCHEKIAGNFKRTEHARIVVASDKI
jgi:hypothetical protein